MDITEDQYVQKLNQFLESKNMVRFAEDHGVDATTCIVPQDNNRDASGNPVAVSLKGCVKVFKSNGLSDGGGMFETFAFDLK